MIDPFGILGGIVTDMVADFWVGVCMSVWAAGLWFMGVCMQFVDGVLSPSLSPTNPDGSPNALTQIYGYTLWIAGILAIIMALVQIGTTLAKRDAQSLGRLVVGLGQYLVVTVTWFTLASVTVVASGGVNRALMSSLLTVNQWSEWKPFNLDVQPDLVGAGVATLLLFMGLLMWLAALFQLLVYIGRAVALLILAATAPIAAAGLVSAVGQPWFWKTLRWYLAAAWSPPLMTLILGIGVTVTNRVAFSLGDSTQDSIALGVAGVVTILASSVSPLALFKLLAFVDPNTSSGANFRAVRRLEQRNEGSNRAAQSDETGRSAGESTAQHAPTPTAGGQASGRTSSAGTAGGTGGGASGGGSAGGGGGAAGGAAGAAGAVGGVAAAMVKAFVAAGAWSAGNVADSTSQMGVGSQVWPQDLQDTNPRQRRPVVAQAQGPHNPQPQNTSGGSDGSDAV